MPRTLSGLPPSISKLAPFAASLALALAFLALPADRSLPASAGPVDYPIVYVRAPRYGDDRITRWPEVKDPIQAEPGTDLMLLHPDGSEELLVPGGNGAIVDPVPSFDGAWVYYARFHDLRDEALNSQRRQASRAGSDIYKIHLPTRQIVRLTHQEWTPNTGVANWSDDPLRPSAPDTNYLGYGIFNLGPCPLPDGRLMFTSSRNGFLPNKSFTFPNLQLFVMDGDGRNVELVGHFNLGSALHPTVLMDGRVMFSSYEAQGLRDRRVWGLWAIWPDGRRWEPLMSAMHSPSAFHFQTQLSDGDIAVVDYYNQNNNGFGSVLAFPPSPPTGEAPFGDANPRHASNPVVQQGYFEYPNKPQYARYAFSPKGLYALTPFTHGRDNASPKDDRGAWMGKVAHPSGAPEGDMLLVWSGGPANHLNRPTNRPAYDGGLYLLEAGVRALEPGQLTRIKDDPAYNEMQPRALVPYRQIYGIDAPAALEWMPNDGSVHGDLPAGTPFGLVGTSSLIKRDSAPGSGSAAFGGLDPFNTSENGASSNWGAQGAEAGRYSDNDIYALRILAMEPTSHRSYGPGGAGNPRGYLNHADERLRILGEIPVRKRDTQGQILLDPDGNPDTSFLARIPADTPFTFQTLDEDGLVLNMSQTWHQLRPGEMRADCGGCHAHAQVGTPFESTAAGRPDYQPVDLTRLTPLLDRDADGKPSLVTVDRTAVDVEYYRDVKPILERSCAGCHSEKDGEAPAGLVLDDHELVSGYENTYNRLARDTQARYGFPPVIRNGIWRQTNASRYVRMFQSRRSLLVWKVFGRRLDGFTNADHPTEALPGDPATLPEGVNPNSADLDFTGTIMPPPGSGYPALSAAEKMTIARWVDLGAPISSDRPVIRDSGWFVDDLRPTLTIQSPRAGWNAAPLRELRIGAFDYYSGLAGGSMSVIADFDVSGQPAGSELSRLLEPADEGIWRLPIDPPILQLVSGTLKVSVSDQQGNVSQLERSFHIGETVAPTALPETPPVPTAVRPTSAPPITPRPSATQPRTPSEPTPSYAALRVFLPLLLARP